MLQVRGAVAIGDYGRIRILRAQPVGHDRPGMGGVEGDVEMVIARHALGRRFAQLSIRRVPLAVDVRHHRRDGVRVIVFEQTGEVLEKRFGFRVAEYGMRRVFPRIPVRYPREISLFVWKVKILTGITLSMLPLPAGQPAWLSGRMPKLISGRFHGKSRLFR